ncbi:nuclear transport factor 2 family protein [Mucilaginibacter sp. HD30]
MKKLQYLLLAMAVFTIAACTQPTAQKEESGDPAAEKAAVEKRVNDFTAATKSGSLDSLNDLTADVLSYGHSNGDIQTKRGFVDSLATKSWKFLELNITDQTIDVHGNTAIVRQKLFGVHQKGKTEPGKLALGVLMVWKKEQGKWVVYARQGFKLLPPNDVMAVK